MQNQVFNRDSQGPSIQRGKAGTNSGDGVPVFVRVQEKKRVCCFRYIYEDPMSSQGQKDKENVANSPRTISKFGPVL